MSTSTHASSLVVFLLVFARISATLVAAPIFVERGLAVQVKIGLSAILAFILTPEQEKLSGPISEDPTHFIFIIAQQILLGLVYALIFLVVFSAAEMAGELIGQQMGITLVESSQPNGSVHSIGQLYHVIAGLIFLGLDGQHWLLLGIGSGLTAIPVSGVTLNASLLHAVLPLGATAFAGAVGAALPLLASLLLADILTGLIGRAIPSLNLFVLGLPLKVAITIAALIITAPFTIQVITEQLRQLPHLNLWG